MKKQQQQQMDECAFWPGVYLKIIIQKLFLTTDMTLFQIEIFYFLANLL